MDSDHILKSGFGKHIKDDDNQLTFALENARKTSYTAARLLLRYVYESMYGLFDHDRLGDVFPLALVSHHPGEDVHTQSRMYNTMKRFYEHGIASEAHCSFEEFLQMPPEYCAMTFAIVSERRNRKNSTANEIDRKLKEEFGKL